MQQRVRPLLISLALAGTLVGCAKQADIPGIKTVAPQAAGWTQQLATGNYLSSIRSSVLLGVYLTHHLLREIVFRSALAGVTAQMSFLSESTQEQDESFALLETLGSILQVDVPDMLNRSPERITAFDTYVSNLQNLSQRGKSHLDSIIQHLEELNKDRRTKRAEVAKNQSLLNRAIRDGDFSTASELQKNLIQQEGAVAVVETEIDQERSIKNLFEDMLDVAEKRLSVMTANRAAILAGITVVDLPGAKDLGILRNGTRFERSGGSIFDPETLK